MATNSNVTGSYCLSK